MITESIYIEFLDALLKGEKAICHQIVDKQIAAGENLKTIYLQLFQKALYRLGRMWEQGKISIAEEHIATQIIDCLLDKHITFQEVDRERKTALVTCVDKEFHHLGAKMVANLFEVNGWTVYFLGGNTPGKEILRVIGEKKPVVVGISFSFYMNYTRFLEVINSIIENFPNQRVIVGGQGISAEVQEKLQNDYPTVQYISCVNALDGYISQYSATQAG